MVSLDELLEAAISLLPTVNSLIATPGTVRQKPGEPVQLKMRSAPPPRWAGRQRHRPPVSLWGISPHQLATGADRQLGGPRHSPDVSTAAADTTENCRHGDMSRQHDPLQAPICRKLSTSRTAHIISGQYDRPRRRVGCALQAIPGREEIRAAVCGSESSRLNWLRGLGRQIPRCSVASKNS